LLWVRRLILFILLLVIVLGYPIYKRTTAERQREQAAKHALATAQVWIASAKFRHDPERFTAYRDSVLEACHLSRERIQDYLSRYKNHPEEYDLFAKLVSQYLDSLSAIEVELLQVDTTAAGDSTKVSD